MSHRILTFLVTLPLVVACSSNEPKTADDCGPEDDLERGADTVGHAAKTGAVSAAKGVETFGSATAKWFEGGSEAASEEWDEKAAETDRRAHEEAAETREAALDDHCK